MWLRCKTRLHHLKAYTKYSKSSWILQTYEFSDAPCKKPKLAPIQDRRMIDRRRICAKGGDGGNGCFSFHRSRHDRRGKADGGNGGRGGDVILECSQTVWDLSSLQHHINAKRGGHGASKNKIGSRGDDKVVVVPVGTVLHLVAGDMPSFVEKGASAPLNPWEIPSTLDNNQHENAHNDSTLTKSKETVKEMKVPKSSSQTCTKSTVDAESFDFWDEEKMSSVSESEHEDKVNESEEESEDTEEQEEEHVEYNVAELTEPGQRLIVAHGGEGGLGNVSISKTLKNSSHKKHDDVDVEDDEDDVMSSLTMGTPGTESVLILELKSIADVGLVGMPNAGKSTLLGALSKAQPKIGHYAFTTLRPNLGKLYFEDLSLMVADIPGLIKGAHQNRGLGHAFLRHIERTRVLAYVLDLAAALDGRKGVPPWEQLRDLIMELEFYDEGLSGKPALVVANKIDEAGADEVYNELRRRVRGVNIFPVCAVLDEGVPELKDGLRMLVNGEDSNKITLDDIEVD
ncbi:probable GTP-binding protein OBGM, mitochondrial [Rutidosis leptorrhynchoides]|uniref:probable GTP-binding protein OBGM, mitochondrial n=1 Tax=Rutidosis leptorrhynchoides TaxID=125765 RepID=UPI003A9A0B7F